VKIPERRQRHLVVVTLLASALLWFRSALVGVRVLYFRDLLQNLYPWRRLWAEEIGHGRWPLWDPFAAGGVPYLANPNTLSLHPLSWLQALLPFDLAFNWLLIGTWLLGEAGAYRLGRRLGQGRAPALITALAYGGSGYLISALNLPNLLLAAAAAPWVCWAMLGVARCARARDVAALAVAVALCLLGGEPVALVVALAASGGLLLGARTAESPPLRRRMTLGIGGVALGLVLAAPLVLPALELVVNSERGEGLSTQERSRWSLDPAGVGEIFLPRFGGEAVWFDLTRNWGQFRHAGTMPLLISLYAGLPLLALAATGWKSLGRRARLWVGSGMLLCLALSAGHALPSYRWIDLLGPPAQWLRYPIKFVIGLFGPLAVLAGSGLQSLSQQRAPGRGVLVVLLALSATLGLVLCADLVDGRVCGQIGAYLFSLASPLARVAAAGLRHSLALALLLSAVTFLLLGPLRSRLRPLPMLFAWGLLMVGDLWAAQVNLVPSAPAGEIRLTHFFTGPVQPGARVFRDERPSGFQLRARDGSRLWGFLFDPASLARHTSSEARVINLLERPTDRLWPAASTRLRRWIQQARPEEQVRLLRRIGAEWWLAYGENPSGCGAFAIRCHAFSSPTICPWPPAPRSSTGGSPRARAMYGSRQRVGEPGFCLTGKLHPKHRPPAACWPKRPPTSCGCDAAPRFRGWRSCSTRTIRAGKYVSTVRSWIGCA
jgi:hypothetical protein